MSQITVQDALNGKYVLAALESQIAEQLREKLLEEALKVTKEMVDDAVKRAVQDMSVRLTSYRDRVYDNLIVQIAIDGVKYE
jgi:hypothetical protein